MPVPTEPLVAVAESDLDRFMANTGVEAYPDPDDDGLQNAPPSYAPCRDGANSPDALDPRGDDALRTRSSDTFDASAGTPEPLVALDDVKPGDFGEVTLSVRLCDNPGYVWLTGGLVADDENGVVEPETADPQEGAGGELPDAIRTRLWVDDGDNVAEVGTGGDPSYLTPVLTLRELLDRLSSDRGIPLCAGGDTGACPADATYDSRHATGDVVTVPSAGGGAALEIPKNPKCEAFGLTAGLKTDEAPEGNLPDSGTKQYQTAEGTLTFTTDLVDGVQTITDWAFDADGDYCVAKIIVKGGREGATVYSYDNPNGNDDFTDDPRTGARGASDAALTTPTGQAISHVSVCLVQGTTGGGSDGEICCLEAMTDHHVGFAWWLPADRANAVQTDSVAFDLGVYAEQCRHNAATTPPPSG
ncbi:MAG: hypothetical protein ABEI99_01015 [Halobaculum sp.]